MTRSDNKYIKSRNTLKKTGNSKIAQSDDKSSGILLVFYTIEKAGLEVI